jgi:hypothetical protein
MPAVIVNDIPIQCVNQAALEFQLPVPLILAVIKTENGRIGLARQNNNGTQDLGPMQINTTWLPRIARYGITHYQLQYDACENVRVGAWILGTSIAGGKDLWTGVGNYHSHSPAENFLYSIKVKSIYKELLATLANEDHA